MRADCMNVAARQGTCADREGASQRRHCDHKTHCYTLDLQLDQGHWIGRPVQVGAAFSDNEERRRVHEQDACWKKMKSSAPQNYIN